jgi:hypothetical protein
MRSSIGFVVEIVGSSMLLYCLAYAYGPYAAEWLQSGDTSKEVVLTCIIGLALFVNLAWGTGSLSGWLIYVMAPMATVADFCLARSYLPTSLPLAILATINLMLIYTLGVRLCRDSEAKLAALEQEHAASQPNHAT